MWKWAHCTPFYTTPQPATGEPVAGQGCGDDATHEAGSDETSFPGAYCDNCGPRAAATTPVLEPAQATQAEVTDGIRPEDFTVEVVVKPMGGFAPVNTQGVRVTHKPTGISVTCDAARSQHTNRHQAFETLRAILALRPERVPMTDEQISLEAHNADDRDWNDLRFRSSWHEGFLEGARFAESHHGITAQPKKEGA